MTDPTPSRESRERSELRELARLFTKLGCVAFGGPAAHIAMMRDEVVVRREWVTEQEFLDLIGATNLIPGPSSTELAIYIGQLRAGWRGLLVAGACFIIPASLITLALAVLYTQYGTTPQGESLLYGISPVIIAVVGYALWGFLQTAVKDRLTAVVGATAFVVYLLGVGEIPLLLGGALAVLTVRSILSGNGSGGAAAIFPLPVGVLLLQSFGSMGMGGIFFTFLKIGSVLFGSGYVLLAFLETEFVGPGLLMRQQIIDAVAIGQFTPGPVFTAATFVGYLLAGVPGAVLATIGIFVPGFILVAVTAPYIPRLRNSPLAANLLDGLVVTSLALMAAVTLQLGQAALVDVPTVLITVTALVLLARFRVNSAWLVIGGGVLGLLLFYL